MRQYYINKLIKPQIADVDQFNEQNLQIAPKTKKSKRKVAKKNISDFESKVHQVNQKFTEFYITCFADNTEEELEKGLTRLYNFYYNQMSSGYFANIPLITQMLEGKLIECILLISNFNTDIIFKKFTSLINANICPFYKLITPLYNLSIIFSMHPQYVQNCEAILSTAYNMLEGINAELIKDDMLAGCYNEISVAYMRCKLTLKAEKCTQQALLKLSPNPCKELLAAIYYNLGLAKFKQLLHDEAILNYKKGFYHNFADEELFKGLINLMIAFQQYDEGLIVCKLSKYKYSGIFSNYIQNLKGVLSNEEFIKYLSTFEQDPNVSKVLIYDLLAAGYFELGNIEMSVECAENAFKNSMYQQDKIENGEMISKLLIHYLKCNEYEKGVEFIEKNKEIHPIEFTYEVAVKISAALLYLYSGKIWEAEQLIRESKSLMSKGVADYNDKLFYAYLYNFFKINSFTEEEKDVKFSAVLIFGSIIEEYFDDSILLFKQVIDNSKNSIDRLILSFHEILAKYHPHKSLEVAQYAIAKYPNDPEIKFCLATSYYYLNNYKIASTTIDAVLKDIDHIPDGHKLRIYQMARKIYKHNGELAKVLNTITKALQINENDYKLYLKRGKYELLLGNSKKADKSFAQAIEIYPAAEVEIKALQKKYAAEISNDIVDESDAVTTLAAPAKPLKIDNNLFNDCFTFKDYENKWEEINTNYGDKVFKVINFKTAALLCNKAAKCYSQYTGNLKFWHQLELALTTDKIKLYGMGYISISLIATAYSKVNNNDQYILIFNKLAEHLNGLWDKKEANPQSIAMLAESFSKMMDIRPFKNVFEQINKYVIEHHHEMSFNHMATVLYSMRKMLSLQDFDLSILYITLMEKVQNDIDAILANEQERVSDYTIINLYKVLSSYATAIDIYREKLEIEQINKLEELVLQIYETFQMATDKANMVRISKSDAIAEFNHDDNFDWVINKFKEKHYPASSKQPSFNPKDTWNFDTKPSHRLLQKGQETCSAFSLLTQEQVKVGKFTLNTPANRIMLSKLVKNEDGELCRIDLSALHRNAGDYGYLSTIPLTQTYPNTSYSIMMKELFLSYESVAYWPKLSSQIENDQILQGRLKLGIVVSDKLKEFGIIYNKQSLSLGLGLGIGYINMGLIKGRLDRHDIILGQKKKGNLSYQALQHYANNEAVVEELTMDAKQQLLAARENNTLNAEQAYNLMSSGVKGELGLFVPSTDGKIYLPYSAVKRNGKQIQDRFSTCANGLIVTKSPHLSAETLQAIDEENIVAGKNNTSEFLSSTQVMQAGLCFLDGKKPYFAKLCLIAVKPNNWPQEFAQADIVFNKSDIKLGSLERLQTKKYKNTTILQTPGILSIRNTYSKGSAVAVGEHTLSKINADCDGDIGLFIAKKNYEQLYTMVAASNQEQHITIAKPLKTYTKVEEDKKSRASYILTALSKLLENCTTLLAVYKNLDETKQVQLATSCIEKITCFAIEKNIFDLDFYQRLAEELAAIPNDIERLEYILRKGIFAGTDAFKANTAVKEFKKMEEIIKNCFVAGNVRLGVPYGRSLLSILEEYKCELPLSIKEKLRERLKDSNTIPGKVMTNMLELI